MEIKMTSVGSFSFETIGYRHLLIFKNLGTTKRLSLLWCLISFFFFFLFLNSSHPRTKTTARISINMASSSAQLVHQTDIDDFILLSRTLADETFEMLPVQPKVEHLPPLLQMVVKQQSILWPQADAFEQVFKERRKPGLGITEAQLACMETVYGKQELEVGGYPPQMALMVLLLIHIMYGWRALLVLCHLSAVIV